MANVRLQLFNCRYEYISGGKRYNYTCNIISNCKEDAEELVNKFFKFPSGSVIIIMEVHGIGDQTVLQIAQSQSKRMKAQWALVDNDNESIVMNGKLHNDSDYIEKYAALPDIDSIINTYKERT